ncbi:hypothetical protein ABH031_25340, partial [Bacteroides ovatus]
MNIRYPIYEGVYRILTVRKGASKQVGNTRAAGKKSRGRRGDVPQGKGQTACMARKKKGAGTAAHAE